MKNLFTKPVAEEVFSRIDKLTPTTKATWGEMSVSQMLAHLNVQYEMVYTDKHPKPNAFTKFMLKAFVKKIVCGTKPYSKNSRTAPQFLMKEDKNFEEEKTRLIAYINKTQELGEHHFEGKESHSFGKLSKEEWNISFYKHIDHHLTQFGV
jgi:2-polyprenyl-3-methyl-5-hydroxy-6-metoxy-1,4-benzoquinol methylase